MFQIMFRAIDWKFIGRLMKWPAIIALLIIGWVIGGLIWGCTPQYPFTPVPIPQPEAEFKDPLAIGSRQKESVALLVDKYGDPEITFSWAGEDFKIEVVRWKNAKPPRYAIRVNDIYRFTWTQFNLEKKEETK